MVVLQYPHYLFAIETTRESQQDESGYWTDEEQAIALLSMCREETNGSGGEVQVADGTYRKFSSLIQLPKGDLMIKEGTRVFVAEAQDGSGIRIDGVVLKFDRGQLHLRLWV